MAHNSVTLPNIAAGTVIVFDKVLFNDGNAYSGTTGAFTAPAEGLYSFSRTVLTA